MALNQPQRVPSTVFNQNVEASKAYIRILQRLQQTNSNEFQKVPEVLKHYSKEEINSLNIYDVQALEGMNVLPFFDNLQEVTENEIQTARSYIRTLHKLRDNEEEFSKVPLVLCNLSEDEIDNLDEANLQALRLMNVFPDNMIPNSNSTAPQFSKLDQTLEDFCNQDPELKNLAKDPNKIQHLANHPKIIAFINSRPDLKQLLDEEVERQMKPFVEGLGFSIPSKPKNTHREPYQSHPYGSKDPTESPETLFNTVTQSMLDRIAQLTKISANPFKWLE